MTDFMIDPPTQQETNGGRPGVPGRGGGVRVEPVLRLRHADGTVVSTGGPASAGRGAESMLLLPDVDTISRTHALFTYDGARWFVEAVGRNGLRLNGAVVSTRRSLENGDLLQWGSSPSSPMSTVQLRDGR